ncbi:MAG: 4-hydroxythreonine-4-phosphate dehydrogenase PdxA [Chloroflexi bacterium]|nr:4-hydroxythreonine-4-phosphate dehydrogenase PdxA [Chloroflexota bacterium]
MTTKPKIAITMGDPSGIGPEVVLKALTSRPEVYDWCRPFVVGSLKATEHVTSHLPSGLKMTTVSSHEDVVGSHMNVEILNTDGYETESFPLGEHSVLSGVASHQWVETAATLARSGAIDAMVTAPINKESWKMAEMPDLGHQEVFKRLSGSDYVATMLVSGSLRCMHLSTHKPLRDAVDYVTTENVLMAVRLTEKHFRDWGFDPPRIAVAALNPHGSDNGLIGSEEAEEISPAVEAAKAEGITAFGPIPADSVFNQAIGGRYDVVVVMYHDQGHIPIKVHGFEESISVNLGIPWLRTSVDHGTAFDITGKWIADETSMIEAIKVAAALASGASLSA